MWDHQQTDSDVAEHRPTVLLHLVALADQPGVPEHVTAADLAREHPELPEDRWLAVLVRLARPNRRTGKASLYSVRLGGDAGPTRTVYALAPSGWVAARRLTAGAAA